MFISYKENRYLKYEPDWFRTSGFVAQWIMGAAPSAGVAPKNLSVMLKIPINNFIKRDAPFLCRVISVATIPGCNDTAVTPVPLYHQFKKLNFFKIKDKMNYYL